MNRDDVAENVNTQKEPTRLLAVVARAKVDHPGENKPSRALENSFSLFFILVLVVSKNKINWKEAKTGDGRK